MHADLSRVITVSFDVGPALIVFIAESALFGGVALFYHLRDHARDHRRPIFRASLFKNPMKFWSRTR